MPRYSLPSLLILPAVMCAVAAPVAHAQFRVATWNITQYSGQAARTPAFQTVIFGDYQGRSMKPDVIVVQEISSNPGVFLSMLNSAAGSPGDYAQATFINGPDMDSCCFYRTSKFTLQQTAVAVDANSTTSTRHVMAYKLRPVGFTTDAAGFHILSCHLKASDSDATRRYNEAVMIRDYLQGLPAGSNFMLAGDFNIYTPNELGWNELIGSQTNNNGRLFDPIKRDTTAVGSTWTGASGAVLHTQSPHGGNSGGMDDRFDFILVSNSLRDVDALSYIGNPNVAYGSVWNDPNHSYRVWGNDGFSYNQQLRVTGNTMVGPVIAQALIDHASSLGHLPVYLDLQVPAKLALTPATTTIDFGTVNIGSVAQQPITITNATSVATFSKAGNGSGIDTLNYTLAASAGFTVPGTAQIEPAGGSGNAHTITLDTSTPGTKTGTLTITSDDPDQPNLVINLTAIVNAEYDFDVNDDGLENIEDLHAWFTLATDVDGNGTIAPADFRFLRSHLRELEQADLLNGQR